MGGMGKHQLARVAEGQSRANKFAHATHDLKRCRNAHDRRTNQETRYYLFLVIRLPLRDVRTAAPRVAAFFRPAGLRLPFFTAFFVVFFGAVK